MEIASKSTEISDRITLVLLDQESLDWARKERGWSWPWPREAYAQMTKYFERAGASSFAFDMIYSEDSLYGTQDDLAFAKASDEFGKVIQTVYYENENSTEGTYPIDVLKNSAAEIGNVTSSLDKADRVARRNLLATNAGNHELALSVASLKVAGELPDLDEIPKAKEGGMYIKYVDDIARFVPYSAKSILISEEILENGSSVSDTDFIPPEQFKDNFVFFAVYAPGLFDVCSTPVSSNYPGIGVHVCQLNSILNQDYLQDVPDAVSLILIFALILVGFLVAKSVRQESNLSLALKTLLVLLVCSAYILASVILFNSGYILPMVLPLSGFILAYLVAVFEDYLSEGHQKRFIKSAFKHYLSAEVIDQLIANPENLKLGGDEKEITAYFSDVQGFTSISENLTPVQLVELLNIYLTAMTDIIQSYGGYVDKYEGDAIVAFFGAPLDQKDNAKRAVDAALACQKKLSEMQDELFKIAKKPFVQRIGLNTGKAVVGNMGSSRHFNYTMMGDTVNLASRLEGINKQFGTYTMCSEATMKSAVENGSKYEFRMLSNIAVVGKKTGVKVYNPMKKEDFDAISEIRKTYDEAYENYVKGDFEKAKELFQLNADKDPPSAKYVEKCQKMIDNPPENWDGILRATEK